MTDRNEDPIVTMLRRAIASMEQARRPKLAGVDAFTIDDPRLPCNNIVMLSADRQPVEIHVHGFMPFADHGTLGKC